MANRYQLPGISLQDIQEGIETGLFAGKPEMLNAALKTALLNTYREEGIPEGEIPLESELQREATVLQSQMVGKAEQKEIEGGVPDLAGFIETTKSTMDPADWPTTWDPQAMETIRSESGNLPGSGIASSTDRFYDWQNRPEPEAEYSPPQTLASGASPPENLRTPRELSAAWTSQQLLPMDYFEELAWNFYLDGDVSREEAYQRALAILRQEGIEPISPYKYDPTKSTLAGVQERMAAQQAVDEYGQYLIPTGGDPRTAAEIALGVSEEFAKRRATGDPYYGGKVDIPDAGVPKIPRYKALSRGERFTGWMDPIISGMGPISGLYKNFLREQFSPLQTQYLQRRSLGEFQPYEAGDPREHETSPFEQFLPTAKRQSTEEKKSLLRQAVLSEPAIGSLEPSFMDRLETSMDQPGESFDFDYAWDAVKGSIPRDFRSSAETRAFRDYQTWKTKNPQRSFLKDFVNTFSFSPGTQSPRSTGAFNGYS